MASNLVRLIAIVGTLAVLGAACEQGGTAAPLSPSAPRFTIHTEPPPGWVRPQVDRDRVFVFSHPLEDVVVSDSLRNTRYLLYADGRYQADSGPGTNANSPLGWYSQSAEGRILFVGASHDVTGYGGLHGNLLLVSYDSHMHLNDFVDSAYILVPGP